MQNRIRNNRRVLNLNPQQLILRKKITLCFSKQVIFKKYLIKQIALKRESVRDGMDG